MAQPTKVKKALETAGAAKTLGATQREGQVAVTQWAAICNDLEASADLRSIATLRRRELEAACVIENAAAREAALANLSSIAQTFQ